MPPTLLKLEVEIRDLKLLKVNLKLLVEIRDLKLLKVNLKLLVEIRDLKLLKVNLKLVLLVSQAEILYLIIVNRIVSYHNLSYFLYLLYIHLYIKLYIF